MKGFVWFGIFITVLFCNNAANAQWYVSGHGGISFLEDAELNVNSPNTNRRALSSGKGELFGGAAGYQFGQLRLEAEVSYRHNTLSGFSAHSFTVIPAITIGASNLIRAEVDAVNFMFNGWYDFYTGTRVTPYIGAGIGGVYISLNDVKSRPFNIGASDSMNYSDDDDVVFGFQTGAGFAVQITQIIDLTVDYRYLLTPNPKFNNVVFEMDYSNHSLRAGLRIWF